MIAIGSWRPSSRLADLLSAPETPAPAGNYLYSEDQKRVREYMAENYTFIIAQALRGTPSKIIAAGHGVTREAIDCRLRPLGLKNPPGVRGRPKSSQPASSR